MKKDDYEDDDEDNFGDFLDHLEDIYDENDEGTGPIGDQLEYHLSLALRNTLRFKQESGIEFTLEKNYQLVIYKPGEMKLNEIKDQVFETIETISNFTPRQVEDILKIDITEEASMNDQELLLMYSALTRTENDVEYNIHFHIPGKPAQVSIYRLDKFLRYRGILLPIFEVIVAYLDEETNEHHEEFDTYVFIGFSYNLMGKLAIAFSPTAQ